jgi:hypothetical protein
MATKKTGLIATVKEAVASVFSDKPARKSPKRVEAGKKAAVTAKVNKAAKTAKKAVKKAVASVKKAPAKKRARAAA